jgi:hypothetical protein
MARIAAMISPFRMLLPDTPGMRQATGRHRVGFGWVLSVLPAPCVPVQEAAVETNQTDLRTLLEGRLGPLVLSRTTCASSCKQAMGRPRFRRRPPGSRTAPAEGPRGRCRF